MENIKLSDLPGIITWVVLVFTPILASLYLVFQSKVPSIRGALIVSFILNGLVLISTFTSHFQAMQEGAYFPIYWIYPIFFFPIIVVICFLFGFVGDHFKKKGDLR